MLGSIIRGVPDLFVLVIVFGITIFVHELGHFIAAIKCGMIVDVFSIGFGPALWQRRYKGVLYKIGWIPFGGYVALPQLDPGGMEKIQGGHAEPGPDGKPARIIPEVSPWKKMIVAVSGVTGNIILAILLAWGIYFSPHTVNGNAGGDTVIGFVSEQSPAYEAGLRAGDKVLAVNDQPVASWHDFAVECALGADRTNGLALHILSDGVEREIDVKTGANVMGVQVLEGVERQLLCVIIDVMEGGPAAAAGFEPGDRVISVDSVPITGVQHFIDLVGESGGRSVTVDVERSGENISLTVTPRYDENSDRALIEVHVGSAEEGVMPWMVHKNPWAQIRADAAGIFRILRALVTPRESRQAAQGLGGPIMIFATLWVSIRSSLLSAIGFLRFLNVNLAILNLLPIPVLDGGHLLFALWEGITRRPVNPKVSSALVNFFAALLIGVLLLLTYRDISRISKFIPLLRESDKELVEQVEPSEPSARTEEQRGINQE